MKTKHSKKEQPVPGPERSLDEITRQALWQRFEAATAKQKERARQNLEILQAHDELVKSGISQTDTLFQLSKRFGKGTSKSTVIRLRNSVEGVDKSDWLPLLMPGWKGNCCQATYTEDARQWIRENFLILSKPALRAVYRRAQNLALRNGWVIPSYDAVKRDIESIPLPVRVLLREGEKALSKMYPSPERDYSTLQIHDIWVTDGRKADVFVKWEDGTVSRPILVAWMDVRSRKILGWEIDQTENADLIRLAFKKAAENSHAIPREALMDNGRGFASKTITGGIQNRYRFKVREDDPLGILPMLGIAVIWALPGRGQSKPIEPFFKNIAEMEKSREFSGAYCGNTPLTKPENFNEKNAVPIALYRAGVAAEMQAYNARTGHRGHAMNKRSPDQVYDALIGNAIVRVPTEEQLRLCLLTAESVKLQEDFAVYVLENRYRADQMAKLDRKHIYTARFNPLDATEDILLYHNERFICSAPLIQRGGFRSQQAARDNTRAERQAAKAAKDMAAALNLKKASESWITLEQDTEQMTPAPSHPSPKVVEMVRSPIELPIRKEEDTEKIDLNEFNQAVQSALIRRAANGGE